MSAAGERLGLRLFLEGLEVPVVSAQVQIGINAPATASIQVVPGDKIVELKARTMVHLFFWDYTVDHEPIAVPPDPARVAADYGVTIDEANQIIARNPTSTETSVEAELRGYKLLFSGEVIGVVIMKTPTGRQAVLQCSDFSTYWDTTYQFFVSYSPNGNFLGTSSAIWAGGESMFDDLTQGHASVLGEYLNSAPQTPGLTKVKGLMGGIIALLEAMGGVPAHTHGINDFFTIAELKNHMLQQITAEQNDDTSQRLFEEKAFMAWLGQGMSSLGELCTFRDMMKLLFQYIYYESVPNPAAMYVKAKQSQTSTKRVTVTTQIEIPAQLAAQIQAVELDTSRFAVQFFTDQPFDEDKYAKSSKASLTKIANSPSLPRIFKARIEQAYPWLDKIKSTANDSRNNLAPLVGPIQSPTFANNRKYWLKVTEILVAILNADERFSSAVNKVTRTAPELDQLHTQIFRPDCFFVAPPRCNVIFPDQYTEFQFSRNFLQETTRLRLSVDWLFGGDSGGLLAEYHFAPDTDAIAKIAKLQGNEGIRALLPWEVYSGILPKFESIHEMNYVAGEAERRRGIKGNIIGAATNYAQRTANFNYLKYRFASRTCEIATKFNPFLVCGFPGLLIERPFILDEDAAFTVRAAVSAQLQTDATKGKIDDMGFFVRTAAAMVGAPTQYLGMIASISHNVQQDGAATSVVMTHARTHRITGDDFLNIFSQQISKGSATTSVSTALNADQLLKNGDVKSLKFLLGATPQDMLQQAQIIASTDSGIDISDNIDSPPLEQRPNGATQFGALLAPPSPPTKAAVTSTQTKSTATSIPLRGQVAKATLNGTRQIILVPSPGGTLGPSMKGPKGGRITQIQCVSDAVVGIVGKDIAKKINANKAVTLTSTPITEVELDPTTGNFVLKGNTIPNSQVTYFWKSIIIYEDLTKPQTQTKLLPIEESIRPPWFSPLYSNWFIGNEIYTPFFGCGSIVDQALFITDQGSAAFGTGTAQQQQMLDQLKAADNNIQAIQKIVADAVAKNITDVPDIESSVDALAYIYGEVRRLNLDVHKFIHDYIRRPIATMAEMLGSDDLAYEIDPSGTKLNLVSGTPGFHSSAIADVGGQLLGLLDNPDELLPSRLKSSGKKSPVSRDLDPRPGRRAAVVAYLADINAGSGSLGIGVEG